MPVNSGAARARAFLEGHPETVGAVRRAVETVAAGFSFPANDLRGEVVQDAISRVVDAVRSGRYRGDASLTTFAHSVAHYTCIEHARRHRFDTIRPDLEALPSPMAGPEESLILEEQFRRRMAALSGLSPPARELLRLIFVERLSYKEAGDRLGLSEAAVKSRVHRYRIMLRDLAEPGEAGSR